MQINRKRRAAVRHLIDERFEGRVADFARAIGRSPAQVWQFMNERNIGERLARRIERKLELPAGSLDSEPAPAGGFSPEERELLEKYRRSSRAWQLMLQRVAGMKSEDERLSEVLTLMAGKFAGKQARKRRNRRGK